MGFSFSLLRSDACAAIAIWLASEDEALQTILQIAKAAAETDGIGPKPGCDYALAGAATVAARVRFHDEAVEHGRIGRAKTSLTTRRAGDAPPRRSRTAKPCVSTGMPSEPNTLNRLVPVGSEAHCLIVSVWPGTTIAENLAHSRLSLTDEKPPCARSPDRRAPKCTYRAAQCRESRSSRRMIVRYGSDSRCHRVPSRCAEAAGRQEAPKNIPMLRNRGLGTRVPVARSSLHRRSHL